MAAGAAIVSVFIAIYKLRGEKVDRLEKEAVAKDAEIEVAAKVVEKEKQAAEFVANNRVAMAIAEAEDDKTNKHYDPNERFYI